MIIVVTVAPRCSSWGSLYCTVLFNLCICTLLYIAPLMGENSDSKIPSSYIVAFKDELTDEQGQLYSETSE